MSCCLVVGAPGVLFAWLEAVLRAAAGEAVRQTELIWLDRSSQVDFAALAADAPARVCLCNFPGAAVLESMRAGSLPVLAVIDDPHDSLRWRNAVTGNSTVQSLREQSLAHTVYSFLGGQERALLVRRGGSGSAAALIAAALDRLGIVLAADALAGIAARFTAPGDASLEAALAAHGEGYRPLDPALQDPGERRLIDQALAPLLDPAAGRKPASMQWPRELFLSGDRPGCVLPEAVDLTGPARVIWYGPYLYLPPGAYQLTVVMAVSAQARGLSFVLTCTRLFGTVSLTRKRFSVARGGVFAAILRIDHECAHDDLEVVLQMERGAIEGRLALLRVAVEQSAGLPAAGETASSADSLV